MRQAQSSRCCSEDTRTMMFVVLATERQQWKFYASILCDNHWHLKITKNKGHEIPSKHIEYGVYFGGLLMA